MRHRQSALLAVALPALLASGPGLPADRPAPRLLAAPFFDPSATASVTVGSSLGQVRQLFGLLPDEHDGTWFSEDCNGGRAEGLSKLLTYTGFTVVLEQMPGSSEFVATSISIDGPQRWVTPGIVVGMSGKSLTSLLGKPDITATDGNSGGKIWHFAFTSPRGDLRVHLSHGVVTRIELNAPVCGNAG